MFSPGTSLAPLGAAPQLRRQAGHASFDKLIDRESCPSFIHLHFEIEYVAKIQFLQLTDEGLQ